MSRPELAHAWIVLGLGIALCGITAYLALDQSSSERMAEPVQVASELRAHVPGGALSFAPNDWEALGKVSPMRVSVQAFDMDATEVTRQAWNTCVSSGQCAATSHPSAPMYAQLPITNVTALEAQRYCDAHNGRLPTRSEWLFAAASAHGHRYPWGQTGLVCRRAVFGIVEGPCDVGYSAPLPVASRPAGATATGIFDLSGNVAEWVTDGEEAAAAGGSFRSTLAGQLKVWSLEVVQDARDDIGFRCVYPASSTAH